MTILIKNVLLYDGSGSKPFSADIFIEGAFIRKISRSGEVVYTASVTYDAHGLAASPGFIDVHSHSDMSLLASPGAFSKISQGVTSEIAGNCGLSPFPVLTDEVREHLDILYKNYDIPLTWSTLSGYAAEFALRAPAVNLGVLCGHNTLKANVTGYKPCGNSRLMNEKLSVLLEETMREGALGMSSGLLYAPGNTSGFSELEALALVLKKYDGVYATHLRSEGEKLIESVLEAAELCSKYMIRLHLSHIKTAGKANHHKINPLLSMIDGAVKRGLRVSADRYPYISSQTNLSIILPLPYDKMDDVSITRRLSNDVNECCYLLEALENSNRDWSRVILSGSSDKNFAPFLGMTLKDISGALFTTPAGIVLKLIKRDSPSTMGAFLGMSEKNLETFISLPWVCCGTDENARPLSYEFGRSHPRGFGSFPEFIKRVSSLSSVEEAVRRVSGLPASIFSIPSRGMLKEGYYADIVIFDPAELASAADFAFPHTPAKGIERVFVNGGLSFSEGESFGRFGRFIKKA